MPYQLLVFDWDGTLMDSQAHIVACFTSAMQDLAVTPLPPAVIRKVIGLGLVEAVQALYPEQDIQFWEPLAKRYRHHFLYGTHPASDLFEGAKEVLRQLKDQGYLLAIATGKSRDGLNHALALTGIGAWFDATRCVGETRSKPHPEMLLQIMDELDITPAQTLMIGDTEYDLNMAYNAQVDAAAVSYGMHDQEQLQACQPRVCLHHINELIPWLRQLKLQQAANPPVP